MLEKRFVLLMYVKNISLLQHEGKSDDVFIILKESRKL
jgi:hypothetical protein